VRTLRNVFRRKARAFLTIFGIAIGVFALVVMGSMAEKITLLVDGGTTYYKDKVSVAPKGGNSFTITPMSTNDLRRLEQVPGAARASANVYMTLSDDMSAVNFGPPASITSDDGRSEGYESFVLTAAQGRKLKSGDHRVAVIGADLVTKLNATVGSTIKVRKKNFTVIGVYAKTLTTPDSTVFIPWKDAQAMYYDSLPSMARTGLDKNTLATSIVVYPKSGEDPETLAKRINHDPTITEVTATGPQAFQDQIAASTSTFTSIIFGIALISLLIGGLSVVNTMTMAVSERTREIGVRKAIGASSGAIMRQFIAEAAVMGILAGAIGLFAGWAVVAGANAAGEAAGQVIFLLTQRLAIGSVLFAVVLAVLAGLYPAWYASGLNPVDALRYE
jgi:putative ABC transport system permease protein